MNRRVWVASCHNLPDWEVDDAPFLKALADVGVHAQVLPWDAPVDLRDFDACLIRTTWDYQEHLPRFLRWIDELVGRLPVFNPPEVLRWNTDKHYLLDLQTRGVRLAPTRCLEAGETVDISALMGECGWERGFLKPCVGATARETLRFDASAAGRAQAQAHCDRLLPAEALLLQPYLPAVETEGELSAVFFDGVLSHGVRKVPVAGDYRVQDDFGAHDEPYVWEGRERAFVEGVMAEAHLRFPGAAPLLAARVDVLGRADGALCLNELELVEPSLFFRHGPGAPGRLAEALLRRL